jgi:DNA-binding PadR family transcriptional regulator
MTARALTTTHRALLCLLSIQPYSAYDLVAQMRRSVGVVWPRADSNLYADLKRLAVEGLATTSTTTIGRRRRTTYAITDAGRRDLEQWLATPGAAPYFEAESVLKLAFAPHSSKQHALSQVAVVAEHAAARLELGRSLARAHAAADGPLPERLHINAVLWRFLWEQHRAMAAWADWARREIENWPSTADSPQLRERGRGILRAALAEETP